MPVAPPRPKGPPLNALRAFEAAARLGGFARAAEELSVTPGAITQHIKTLEEWIGAPLFERRSQGVQLTAAGARLRPEFTAAFDRMGEAIHSLREVTETQVIHIAALPSIAQLWLSARLPRLREENPHVQFSVTALEQPPNLLREMFDWSLFLEPGPVIDGVTLAQDEILPVCAPALAATIKTPDDLAAHSLLIDETWARDWDIWAQAAGWDRPTGTTSARFSLYALAVEETRNGAGVLMGHKSLVQADIETGRLVAPLKQTAQTDLCLVLRSTSRGRMIAESLTRSICDV